MTEYKMNYQQAQQNIKRVAEVLPVVSEMQAAYKKWRKFYRDLGDSPKTAHKKASAIIIRDYPNFNLQVEAAGISI